MDGLSAFGILQCMGEGFVWFFRHDDVFRQKYDSSDHRRQLFASVSVC
jgi:hypothetical protein